LERVPLASKSPLFSVIVPVFNAGEYLDRAIASARAQTLTDFELILVDDGSTDDACDRACSIQDSRLRFMRQANQGAPVALNRALAAASGEYVALLDADDFWAPTKLDRHLDSFHAHPEADLTFTGIVYVGADDEPLNLPQRRPSGRFTFEQLFVDYVIGSSSAMAFRKAAAQTAGAFDPAMRYMYDVDFVLRIARIRPGNIVGMTEPLTFYRRRSGQQTSDWRPMADYWEKLLDRHRLPDNRDAARLVRRASLNTHRYLSYLAYEQGDLSSALSLLGTAFVTDPFRFAADTRNWKLAMACGSAIVLPKRIHHRLEKLVSGGPGARASRLERAQRDYT
jgi:glycosyltransferase involved in cell wall biosynthesis